MDTGTSFFVLLPVKHLMATWPFCYLCCASCPRAWLGAEVSDGEVIGVSALCEKKKAILSHITALRVSFASSPIFGDELRRGG